MANQRDQDMNVNQKPTGSQSNESSTSKTNPAGKRAEDSKLNIQDATKQKKQVEDQDFGDIE